MPTYDGTYKLAVEDGRVLIRDVEGGSQTTHVPLEIYSNYAAQGTLTDSRQLRLRTQPYLESNTANAYVTDMGIESKTDNYFFITAPQKTSNVGDQNTFVISSTSNIGIGTTNPEKPLHVMGDSWITGTLTASNIIGASPVTISSDIVMAAGTTLTTAAIEPPAGAESNLKITGTITTSNIVANTGDNLLVSSNLEVGTSNLFVDTTTGNVGIGTTSPGTNLHIVNTADITTSAEVLRLQRGDGTGDIQSNTRGTIGMYLRDSNLGGGEVARISWGHDGGDADPEGKGRLGFWTSDTSGAEGVPVERMTIRASGRVGIATASPSYKLHVWGGDSETTIVGATGTNQGTGVFYVGQSPAYGGGIAYNGDGSPDWDGSGSDYISLFRRENNANSWTARNFYNSNNWEFRGAVSKASGSFKIDHPLPELSNTHNLYHSFIEGPQADLIYRGKIQLVDGHAEINIDTVSNMTEGTFVALNRNTQCFTTNETDWDPVRGSLVGNILTIECQNTSSVATISWMVIGERQDKHMYDTEWTDDNGKVIPEQPKT